MRHDQHAGDDCFDGTEPATLRHNIDVLSSQQPDGEEPEDEDRQCGCGEWLDGDGYCPVCDTGEQPTVLMPELSRHRRRRRLLVLHERNALESLQATAAIQRLDRSNVRFMWLQGRISDARATELLRAIDERETSHD
jgi:hypothetical protein